MNYLNTEDVKKGFLVEKYCSCVLPSIRDSTWGLPKAKEMNIYMFRNHSRDYKMLYVHYSFNIYKKPIK